MTPKRKLTLKKEVVTSLTHNDRILGGKDVVEGPSYAKTLCPDCDHKESGMCIASDKQTCIFPLETTPEATCACVMEITGLNTCEL